MIALQETIEINRPVAEVYNYVVNIDGQKWQPAVIEVKKLTEGPVRVGSRFNETAKMMGRRVHTVCEITALEPDKRISFKATSDGPVEYETTYTLEDNGNATRLNISGNFRTKGFWRLLEPLFKGEVKKESLQELAAMKAAIEGRKK